MIAILEPLAHSAPAENRVPQTYAAHIGSVRLGADQNAEAMCRFRSAAADRLICAVADSANYHDLGKLDPVNQTALREGRKGRMCWDHIDAGVAHLMKSRAEAAAWLVRAHHRPGLPRWAARFKVGDQELRGRRSGEDFEPHERQIEHTDLHLPLYLATHEEAIGRTVPTPLPAQHGLSMRLALSCLVDADHTDAARFDQGRQPIDSPPPRWEERLASLDRYVRTLKSSGNSERDRNRTEFYEACRNSPIGEPLVACEGPVGIGKTTAITAYLIRVAIEHKPHKLRRLFIVAPYTNVISQTAERLREALTLEGERGEDIVAEHHHRADFQDIDARDLAVIWRAPIVVTTAVQFFETLASNDPGRLRKLHSVPGSVVFLDEAHAALPTPLWGQNWLWLCELANEWSCHFVFASGSLARFWEKEAVVGNAKRKLLELTPPDLAIRIAESETRRIRYCSLGRLAGIPQLIEVVRGQPGPRLVILNTVQSAAVVARAMAEAGHDVMHLSTALCPGDRDVLLRCVSGRLKRPGSQDWTLVATSCVEAGVDLSFRTAFRERFGTASLIQVGGRVNRHGIHDVSGGGMVFDFLIDEGNGVARHPAAAAPAAELARLFADGEFKAQNINTSALVTLAMDREMRNQGTSRLDLFRKAEREWNYPEVACLGTVIAAKTCIVIVDKLLCNRLKDRDRVSFRELLRGSVQIWATKIEPLGLDPIRGREDIFWFPHDYDSVFLGYMAGALKLIDIGQRGFVIV